MEPPAQAAGDGDGEAAGLIRVDAGGWGLTWAADAGGRLRQVGLGTAGHRAGLDVDAIWYPDAYPTWGGGDPYRPAALRITHADGTLTTRLVVHEVTRTPGPDGEHVVVTCRDEMLPLTVEHHLRTHPDSGVLEQWVEVLHQEDGPVRLMDYDSVAPFLLAAGDAELCQFGGSGWADEWAWTTERLTPGTKSLGSLGGVQPHLQRSPCVLLSPRRPVGRGRRRRHRRWRWHGAATPASTWTCVPPPTTTHPGRCGCGPVPTRWGRSTCWIPACDS